MPETELGEDLVRLMKQTLQGVNGGRNPNPTLAGEHAERYCGISRRLTLRLPHRLIIDLTGRPTDHNHERILVRVAVGIGRATCGCGGKRAQSPGYLAPKVTPTYPPDANGRYRTTLAFVRQTRLGALRSYRTFPDDDGSVYGGEGVIHIAGRRRQLRHLTLFGPLLSHESQVSQ
jgi:hypothetical protein